MCVLFLCSLAETIVTFGGLLLLVGGAVFNVVTGKVTFGIYRSCSEGNYRLETT